MRTFRQAAAREGEPKNAMFTVFFILGSPLLIHI
jgi:hypothetical protein